MWPLQTSQFPITTSLTPLREDPWTTLENDNHMLLHRGNLEDDGSVNSKKMWRHRGGMSCACPGGLEVSRGSMESKHVMS